MKKKLLIGVLSLVISAATIGCSLPASISKNTENTSTEESNTVNVSSDVYKVLDLKTDWEEKALVTFADSDVDIKGAGCSMKDEVLYITEGGLYTLTGTSKDAAIVINTDENVKIVLSGVDLTNDNGPVIYGYQVKNLYIDLAEGTINTLTDGENYETDSNGDEIGKGVISCQDDVIILGEGTLNINSNHKHGISSDDKLYIESGTINIVSKGTDGMNANELICIDGGTIDITATSDLMECEDIVVINDGTITGTSDNEGIESKNEIYINGGIINFKTVDDGLNASSYIEINDGEITIVASKGDAVDSNGTEDGAITINGGTLNLTGGDVPEGALDADAASVIINGGKVTATGGCNSPIIENGGENNITGETFTGPGGQGGPGGDSKMPPQDFDPNNLPEDFDPDNMPEDFNPDNKPENFDFGTRPDKSNVD